MKIMFSNKVVLFQIEMLETGVANCPEIGVADSPTKGQIHRTVSSGAGCAGSKHVTLVEWMNILSSLCCAREAGATL